MTDPFFWIDNHNAIIGASDAGKTWTAKWAVEEMLRQKRHTCIIDPLGVWWGLRSSVDGEGDGFSIPIFGGPHADFPIRPTDGDAIGGIIVDQRASAIIDLSQLYSGPEQRLFVRDLVARFRRRPDKANFHFVVDEADEFIPEKTRDDIAFALQEDMLWVAKKGRSSGWVQTLITQRTADVAKSSLSMSQTIIAHQLISPQDQKPFLDYVRKHGSKAELEAIEAKLASLQKGERYLYSPRARVLTLGRTPAITTFDSSSTPPAGESRREPRTLAQLDVSAIAAALAPNTSTGVPPTKTDGQRIAEREADAISFGLSAARLRTELDIANRRVAELEQENASLVEKCSIYEASFDRLSHEQVALMESVLSWALRNPGRAAVVKALAGAEDTPSPAPAPPPKRIKSATAKEGASPPTREQTSNAYYAGGPAAPLPPAQQSILDKLAWACAAFRKSGVTRQVLAIVLGVHPRTKGFLNNLGALRTAGLIDYADGNVLVLTATGVAKAEKPKLSKAPLENLREQICKWLPPAQAKVLGVLLDRFPHSIARDSLAETLGFHPRTKGFLNNLGRLRALGLIAGHTAQPRAAGYLFGKD